MVRLRISPGSRNSGSGSFTGCGGGITGFVTWVGEAGPLLRLARLKSFAKRKCSKRGRSPLKMYGRHIEMTVLKVRYVTPGWFSTPNEDRMTFAACRSSSTRLPDKSGARLDMLCCGSMGAMSSSSLEVDVRSQCMSHMHFVHVTLLTL